MRRQWIAVLAGVGMLVFATVSQAAPPQHISFQARVTDASNNSIADATHAFLFNLYNESNVLVWSETQNLPTRAGMFSTLLGSVTPLPNLAWDTTYTVGYSVDGSAEMTPRYALASSPYSLDNKWSVVRAMKSHVRLAGSVGDSIWFGSSDTSTTGLYLHQRTLSSSTNGLDVRSSSSGLAANGIISLANGSSADTSARTAGVRGLAFAAVGRSYGGVFAGNVTEGNAYGLQATSTNNSVNPIFASVGVLAQGNRYGSGTAVGLDATGYSTATTANDTAFGIKATALASGDARRIAGQFTGSLLVTDDNAGYSRGAYAHSISNTDGAIGFEGYAEYTGSGNTNSTIGVIGHANSTTQNSVGGQFEAFLTSSSAAYVRGIDVQGISFSSTAGSEATGAYISGVRHTSGRVVGTYTSASSEGSAPGDTAFGLIATATPLFAGTPTLVAAKFVGDVIITGDLHTAFHDTGGMVAGFTGGFQVLGSSYSLVFDGTNFFVFTPPAAPGLIEVDVDFTSAMLTSTLDYINLRLEALGGAVIPQPYVYNTPVASAPFPMHAHWTFLKTDNSLTNYLISAKITNTGGGGSGTLMPTGPGGYDQMSWSFHPR